ncbi:hypothetical protein ScPMuIL_013588 [Solemya velum]
MTNPHCKFQHADYGVQGSKFTVTRPVFALTDVCIAFTLSVIAYFAVPFLRQTQGIIRHLGTEAFNQREVPYVILFTIILAIVLKVAQKKILEESVMISTSLGITLTTKYALGNSKTEFLDIRQIKDLVILEAVTLQTVIFFLAFLLKAEGVDKVEKTCPIFLGADLPIDTMRLVYQVSQTKLFPTDRNKDR